MKSHVRPAGPPWGLIASSWARFSPTSVAPASASAPSSSTGTYLTAARTSISFGSRPVSAIASRTRSRFVRTSSALSPWTSSTTCQPRDSGLSPGHAAIPSVRKQQRGVRADRAHRQVVDLLDAGTFELVARDRRQMDVGSSVYLARVSGERLVNLGPDLVATRPGARSDCRCERSRAPGGAQGTYPSIDHAVVQAPP